MLQMLQWEILPNSFWKQGSNICHHHLPQLSMLKAEQRKKPDSLGTVKCLGGLFWLITDNWTKPEKQSEGTGCVHRTKPCPTTKINTLLQKEETVLTLLRFLKLPFRLPSLNPVLLTNSTARDSSPLNTTRHPHGLPVPGGSVHQGHTCSWRWLFQVLFS